MQNIIHLIFELGHLRRISHEGWKLTGNKNPETVAEHSLRTAQIGYLLAHLEHYPHPEQVCTICTFHDIAETRIGDIHKVANRYITVDETQAVKEQTTQLKDIGTTIFNIWNQAEQQNTQAGIIAKDADLLDMAFTAREYQQQGYHAASDWLDKIAPKLKTQSAKELMKKLIHEDPFEWWDGLKKT